ncbi:MAG: hypothetical protein J5808_03420, partial [Paludibacteraceae bacterium]|nr:hypothetical protein [Paludibacteraceae bacterium]
DAVTMITIHKSKGLDFGFVFMPYCSWNLENHNQSKYLKCTTDKFEFLKSGLPIPITKNARMLQSYFSEVYKEDVYKTYVDNLNLLYVAFTRSKYGLYLYSGGDDKVKVKTLLERALHGKLNDDGFYETGEVPTPPDKKESVSGMVTATYPVVIRDLQLRLHDADDESVRSWGTKLHAVLSHIGQLGDLDMALDIEVREGRLAADQRSKAHDELSAMFALDDVKPWFDGSMESKTEAAILSENGTYRPDRVLVKGQSAKVIDYKFGAEKSSYDNQVRRYMNLLKAMGYTDVQGAIYYHQQQRVVSVSPSA